MLQFCLEQCYRKEKTILVTQLFRSKFGFNSNRDLIILTREYSKMVAKSLLRRNLRKRKCKRKSWQIFEWESNRRRNHNVSFSFLVKVFSFFFSFEKSKWMQKICATEQPSCRSFWIHEFYLNCSWSQSENGRTHETKKNILPRIFFLLPHTDFCCNLLFSFGKGSSIKDVILFCVGSGS